MYFLRRKNKGLAESVRALEEATESLDRVKSREDEVHDIAESLKDIRERNHFAEQLGDIFFGGSTHQRLGGGHAK